MSWIRQRLLEEEHCPRNLGAEVLRLWSAWREAHPEQGLSGTHICPDCDEPGLIYIWWARHKDQGKRVFYERGMTVCRCHPSKRGRTKKQLEHEGYIVMPSGFAKRMLEFERSKGLAVRVEHMTKMTQSAFREFDLGRF